MFSNYASCTGESVCVYGGEYVQVECWLRNIRSDTFIKQLLVRGNCGAASRFKKLCRQDVGFIEMMNSNDTFSCAGNPPPPPFPLIFLILAKSYIIHSDGEFIDRPRLQSTATIRGKVGPRFDQI